MNPLTLNNPLFSTLFFDRQIAQQFGAEATIKRFITFEIFLAEALADCGAVPKYIADEAIVYLQSFEPDTDKIYQASAYDGLPVPEFIRQLKEHTPEDLHAAIHFGVTSQDLIDTAHILTYRDINTRLEAGLTGLSAALQSLIEEDGGNALMGRTRMQAAYEITVADRMALWMLPILDHLTRLEELRPRFELLQLGGPVGDRAAFGDHAEHVTQYVANRFGLHNPAKSWHAMRDGMAEYASWLSLVTGTLGKMGRDITLMAQQGLDEVALSGGGTSSAMPHKNNPVLGETLEAFARYNATQVSGMHSAQLHEQERSGASWTLEWMILPAMAMTTTKSVKHALRIANSITRIGEVPSAPKS